MPESSGSSFDQQLAQLEAERQVGRITAFEYQARKKDLLARRAAAAGQPVPLLVADARPTPASWGQPPAPAASAATAAVQPPAPSSGAGWQASSRGWPNPTVASAPAEPAPQSEPTPNTAGPAAWKESQRRRGVKRWMEGARPDDPTARSVFAPLAAGIGLGKAFFFLFGFKRHAEVDQKMLQAELLHIADDIEVLRKAGYTVVVDQQATRDDFVATIAGKGEGAEGLVPAGFYWSAHGLEDGGIECCDADVIRPDDVDPTTVSAGLRLAIFGACYVGSRSRSWRKALGGHPLVVGWGRPVTIDRAVDFLEPDPESEADLDDLIRRYLLTDAPLPTERTPGVSPLEAAAVGGRLGDVPDRIQRLVGKLAAKWRMQDRCIEVFVPLEGGRSHIAKVFVVDGTEPFCEGEPMLAVEADVGELSAVVDPAMLLGGLGGVGYARVMLVKSTTEEPRIVAQGFLPLARVRDQDLAALVYQVCLVADTLESRIFGGNMR